MIFKRLSRSRFFPLARWHEDENKAHGRIEKRVIYVLPCEALSEDSRKAWPSIRQIAKIERSRHIKKKGKWVDESETAWLISSLTSAEASPEALLGYNRQHWRIENNLHRNKDVALGEDGYTNRKDNAPRNIFSLNNLVLLLFKIAGLTPKRAIESFQDDKNRAISLVCSLL
jgi:predicted transposase YbfD/YdcC